MSCNSGNSTRTIKGKYDKKLNLQKPISYTIDKKGNVKPVYSTPKNQYFAASVMLGNDFDLCFCFCVFCGYVSPRYTFTK